MGWSNALPAAATTGQFEILGGEKFTVNGFGYHDKNWGDTIFETAIENWFWGHAHFGPWSIVFFNGSATSGDPFADAYISKNGKLLVSSCQKGSVLFDPTYDALGILQSAVVRMPLSDGGELRAEVVSTSTQVDYPLVYSRTLVIATGGEVGGPKYSGPGTVEHFSV